MNRREFCISALVGSTLSHFHYSRGATQESTPAGSIFPEQEEVVPGLVLVDQRLVIRDGGDSMFFGEMRNDLAAIYDSPQFLQTFYDIDGNIMGENFVNPVVGFMRPGESDFLVAPASGQYDFAVDEWEYYRLAPRHPWPDTVQITYTYNPGLVIESVINESLRADSYEATVDVINATSADINGGTVHASMRDANGRFSGFGEETMQSVIPPGKKARFRIAIPSLFVSPYDPFNYLETRDYTAVLTCAGIAY